MTDLYLLYMSIYWLKVVTISSIFLDIRQIVNFIVHCLWSIYLFFICLLFSGLNIVKVFAFVSILGKWRIWGFQCTFFVTDLYFLVMSINLLVRIL